MCKTLIDAFVTARVDYCNSLLYGQPKCILRRLKNVLNSAARLIHLTSRHERITPLLIQLHWLPIEHRITCKIAVITFKALHGAAPNYITDLIKPHTPGRLLRSSSQLLLSKPKVMVAGLLLLLHPLFGVHFHSSLDLVIPFLPLNLSLRLGFLKFLMMLPFLADNCSLPGMEWGL